MRAMPRTHNDVAQQAHHSGLPALASATGLAHNIAMTTACFDMTLVSNNERIVDVVQHRLVCEPSGWISDLVTCLKRLLRTGSRYKASNSKAKLSLKFTGFSVLRCGLTLWVCMCLQVQTQRPTTRYSGTISHAFRVWLCTTHKSGQSGRLLPCILIFINSIGASDRDFGSIALVQSSDSPSANLPTLRRRHEVHGLVVYPPNDMNVTMLCSC